MRQKKFKHISRLSMIILLPFSLCCCKEKNDENSNIAADKLFEKSLLLLTAYTDSLKTAKDSAHVESLARAFESKINAVNFEFPPDTDLKLSQEENDSLIKMTDRLVDARISRLKWFATPSQDSVPTDSLNPTVSLQAAPPSHNQHN
ncbi:MAG: hypothetical protein K2G29_03225 [Muribaculaceae bacterium]|nr:hypothetical protein [Muribaculaceae bacterium]MDE6423490.1 hypothetical protein [Muribaculaceae bacterium]